MESRNFDILDVRGGHHAKAEEYKKLTKVTINKFEDLIDLTLLNYVRRSEVHNVLQTGKECSNGFMFRLMECNHGDLILFKTVFQEG